MKLIIIFLIGISGRNLCQAKIWVGARLSWSDNSLQWREIFLILKKKMVVETRLPIAERSCEALITLGFKKDEISWLNSI